MSVPKRRHTSSRRDRRRSHNSVLKTPSVVPCKSCGSKTVPHRACVECGTYRGRQVISSKE
ncbi:MAG: 50S ribosomal protein L32 [Candidatus Moraniibacteriota bacterium]|nr:MAG: 50S ribosomal protein L32 [Candidatus Moranbacteria bacterium]